MSRMMMPGFSVTLDTVETSACSLAMKRGTVLRIYETHATYGPQEYQLKKSTHRVEMILARPFKAGCSRR